MAWVRDRRGTGYSVYDDSATYWFGSASLPDVAHASATVASYEPLPGFFAWLRLPALAAVLWSALQASEAKALCCISRNTCVFRRHGSRDEHVNPTGNDDTLDEDAPDLDER